MTNKILIPTLFIVALAIPTAYLYKRQENIQQAQAVHNDTKDRQEIATYLKQMFPLDSRRVFKASQDVTLYALNATSEGYAGKNAFHQYKVLNSARIKSSAIKDLRSAFYKNANQKTISALCFYPHHGIRAIYNGKTLDFVICFGCGSISTYYRGKEISTPFSASERETFNTIYRRAGLQIKDDWP